ncbi:RsmB/NOP family class I SAM-dependent RNA methyltransferase [Paenibacillus fonticola]|uniref:RsmB/NOP family class I SAM-dependent RNA methyltransferase n=1 Tax=Paenibacillus fonticola TaxID=379896 RepID=UPI00037A73FE|nr:RsmB/NOP family class I SAM-dependent RNA methyltransferase [Paenibacillus fonticola]
MSTTSLPESFRAQMISMLGEAEGRSFLNSYDSSRTYGLRINTRKIKPGSPADNCIRQLFRLQPVPWCDSGYYYDKETRPGKHPYHAAGLYYIQEPSAMSAVELLAPEPGETVLDLAAAPGGKTTQIAMKMMGEGLLISNEIHPQRAKILAENVERCGAGNVVVTQAAPGELSARFPLAFDRIMLDAPCSGEGMFRKDPDAMAEWSPESVEMCAARQWDILHDAIKMLKPGGYLAYSTCTFNRLENEETISRLLECYPSMKLLAEKRIWPHLHKAEGHFIALLQRDPEDGNQREEKQRSHKQSHKLRKDNEQPDKSAKLALAAYMKWMQNDMAGMDNPFGGGIPLLFGESLYVLPASKSLPLSTYSFAGLKVPRAGLHLGEYKKGRFQPAHALAMVLSANDTSRTWTLKAGSDELSAYLHGDTLKVPENYHGWYIVAVECGGESFPLGWGKASNGQLKNHLPKGLRQPIF